MISRCCTTLFTLAACLWAIYAGGRPARAESDAQQRRWFDLVAEADQMAQDEKPKPLPPPPAPAAQGAVAPELPAPPAPDMVLARLIDDRQRHVDDTNLFATLEKMRAGKPPKDPRKLGGDMKRWFELYYMMRQIVPMSRADAGLNDVTQTLENAINARKQRGKDDFVEGRILAAVCHLYAGDQIKAASRLDEAARFLDGRLLNMSAVGNDCCFAGLLLGKTDAVKANIAMLKDDKVFPKSRLTPFQMSLVAMHAWQTANLPTADDWFGRVVIKSRATKKPKIEVADGAELIAGAALFWLAAHDRDERDPARASELLKKIPDTVQLWQVRRARAAQKAHQAAEFQANGSTQDADRLWNEAAQELEACQQESLPTLDAEIDAQLAAYRGRKPWYREFRSPSDISKKTSP